MFPRLLIVLFVFVTVGSPATVVCAACHPVESKAFAGSAMGQSIGPPVRNVPSGQVTHSSSGTVANIAWINGQMVHRLSELGFRANYSIGYQIGAGKAGHSYIAELGPYLLQSPVSYYSRYGWDISPGFQDAAILDFDRVLGDKCLFCHAANVQFIGSRRLASGTAIRPIDCARCHGDPQDHLSHPLGSNIVNPARLSGRERDSICEQCHLEGVARVLNPGKNLNDFRAGQELEATFSIYVDDLRQPGSKVVSQVEQLALSRCARESGGRLWCGTCHDPHGVPTTNRISQITAICNSCHSSLPAAGHPPRTSDCTKCHMPRLSPNDVAHTASTDHRILANPQTAARTELSGSLRPWHESPAVASQRNLGLAELAASALPQFHSLGDFAGRLLEGLPSSQRENDPVVLSALGDMALSRGDPEKSETFFRKASELAPLNAEYRMYLGIAIKQKGDLENAARAFHDAIDIDPSLQRACLELSALYAKQGKTREASAVLDSYLKWNPESISVRSARESLP